jgi:sodium transport system ATP-binding protein
MHEVEKLCSRVAIIHKGRVQAMGRPDELLERFDQPNLEELFFFLVELAGPRGRLPMDALTSWDG